MRRLLQQLGYSLQAPSKQKEGTQSPDRDAQFNYLNDTAVAFVKDGQPVISCDTKKKELVGELSNGGAEWHPVSEPTRTKTHDFVDKDLGRAVPYGVHDIENDEGWVSVGDIADTASFAVEAIRRWWYSMGKPRFPDAHKLLIAADAGGSTATGSNSGRSSWPNWLKRRDSRSPSATTRRAPRSGTRSSTACSASSP